MSEMNHAEVPLIHHILLKPMAKVQLTEQNELSADYLDYLRQALSALPVPSESNRPVEAGAETGLHYVRPMSGGVHVLRLEPASSRVAASVLTATLSDLAEVEYAEPNLPRSHR